MKKRKKPAPIWSARPISKSAGRNVEYCAGRDVSARPMADEVLIPYDLWTNKAHLVMLFQRRIVGRKQAAAALRALGALERRVATGRFRLRPECEDVHTNIEEFVAQEAGSDVTGCLHTGRSRNDQTTNDVRLYLRDALHAVRSDLLDCVSRLIEQAGKNLDCVMPGFSHMQPAALTTWAHWQASHAQALLRDVVALEQATRFANICPLGAAAGFGTSWRLDRKLVASLLGFESVQENSLDAVGNRWEMEARAGAALAMMMDHFSILAQDLILLSSPPREWITLSRDFVTGSSIMPQKRNPDFAEVTRAKASVVQGLLAALLSVPKGMLSGYNRDTQWTKYLIMDLFHESGMTPRIFAGVVGTLKVHREKMRGEATKDFINAVDVADYVAQSRRLPFRKSYKAVAEAVNAC
ncbi:MAG: argininosuccinate lyase, partial [bacterium]